MKTRWLVVGSGAALVAAAAVFWSASAPSDADGSTPEAPHRAIAEGEPPTPAATHPTSAGLVAVSPAFLDLGELAGDSLGAEGTLVQDFVFRNDGVAELTIVTVSSTCSCTGLVPDRNVVPPGGSVSVRMTVTPSFSRPTSVTGRLLLSDDSVVECGLRAIVRSPCEVGLVDRRLLLDGGPLSTLRLQAIGHDCESPTVPVVKGVAATACRFSGWERVTDRNGRHTNVLRGALTIEASAIRGLDGVFIDLRNRGDRATWIPIDGSTSDPVAQRHTTAPAK